MANPTKTEAVKRFLDAKTHKDLAALYAFDMECQVNVAQDDGEPESGEYKGKKWRGFSNGVESWKSFRVPYNAATNPEFEDSEIKYNLERHVESIGMTGWNWKQKKSYYVGFDFDAISGHSEKHTKRLTSEQLLEVQKSLFDIPWVTIRKSTSGKGLHVYVHLEPYQTENHNEHAALARSILGQMSALAGQEFHAKVDVCGAVLWVWHRKMIGTDGLTLIKQGSTLPADQIPSNWKEHTKVVTGQQKKIRAPKFLVDIDTSLTPEEEKEKLFQELCGQVTHQPLDGEHKKLIDYLQSNNCEWWWDSDNHMLVTHTLHLKEAHKALNLRGIFETTTTGSSVQNCFLYPMRRGSWSVRRYTPGVKEHDSWDQDGNGWTRCYLNREPDLHSAAKSKGGIEHPNGGYAFKEVEVAFNALQQLGVALDKELPSWIRTRAAKVKEHKDKNRIVVEIEQGELDNSADMIGWILERKKWKKVFNTNFKSSGEIEIPNYDDLVRHLITESGEDYGWLLRSEDRWQNEPLNHIKMALGTHEQNPKDILLILGSNVTRPWTIVNRPFQPEYTGNRTWNRNAAQLKYLPKVDVDHLTYPTWLKVLDHCGAGLDEAIKNDPWARSNSILTGGDYLKLWIASIFQHPYEPLPYLFFWSNEENTGKSIFHEALSLLVTKGVIQAYTALVNPQGFNAELVNAILCVIEEMDLKKNQAAYSRIKDWVTSLHISIHKKGETPYTVRNTTHWIHCANSIDFCPIFPGDTRITVVNVKPIDPMNEVPKRDLLVQLEKEAQDFITEILRVEIPPPLGRLNIPVIATQDKIETQSFNKNPVLTFIDEMCFEEPGYMISISEFYDKFQEWLTPEELASRRWTKVSVGRELQSLGKFPKGRCKKTAQWNFGNISFVKMNSTEKPLKIVNDMLTKDD